MLHAKEFNDIITPISEKKNKESNNELQLIFQKNFFLFFLTHFFFT